MQVALIATQSHTVVAFVTATCSMSVCMFQAELQQYLRDLLKEAAVDHVEELLSANVAREWHRTARVNLLKMTVAEALAWLQSPPAAYKKWASLVCAHLPLKLPCLRQLRCHSIIVASSWGIKPTSW